MIDQYTLESLTNMFNWMKSAEDLIRQKHGIKSKYQGILIVRYEKLFRIIMNRKLPLSKIEILQFRCEFDRLELLSEIFVRTNHVNSKNDSLKDASKKLDEMTKRLINHSSMHLSEEKLKFQNEIKDFDTKFKTNIIYECKKELDEVFKAVSYDGTWHTCPKGHFYQIGNCRQPNEKGICPECKKSIGSVVRGHSGTRLAQGNTRHDTLTQAPQSLLNSLNFDSETK